MPLRRRHARAPTPGVGRLCDRGQRAAIGAEFARGRSIASAPGSRARAGAGGNRRCARPRRAADCAPRSGPPHRRPGRAAPSARANTAAARRGCAPKASSSRPNGLIVASACQRAEGDQQFERLRRRTGRRRIKPAQRLAAPGLEFKHQLRELDLGDLGRARGIEPAALRPQAIRRRRGRAARRGRRAGRPRLARC